MAIRRYRGCLALRLDAEVEKEIREMLEGVEIERTPEEEWHVTLVTKEELRSLDADAVTEAMELSTRCFPIGVGRAHNVYFVVCVWPKAQAFRMKLGLPLKDFHVSVSTANRHDVDKTSSALVDDACLQRLDRVALEALSRQVLLERKADRALEIATLLCSKFGRDTTRGWVWLADAAMLSERHKLAMLSYALLLDRMLKPSGEYGGEGQESQLWKHCCAQISLSAETTEWGPVFVDGEIDQIPVELKSFLCEPWSISLWLAIRESAENTSMALTLPSRTHFTVPFSTGGKLYKLPRFFRWLVPVQLAAMSTPRNEEDIRCLCYSLHVRHVVTLTEEEPLPSVWFDDLPTIKNTLLPVANYHAPSIAQIDMFMRLCCSSSPADTPVLVHCGGGKGRAGTMIACYLVAFGFKPPPREITEDNFQPAMSAAEAIQALRAMRPGSIETKEQEEAVSKYCSLLWKRRGVFTSEPAEPQSSRPEIIGEPVAATDLLVLCGIPGSGKSSFRKALSKRLAASLAAPKTVRANNTSYLPWTEIHSDDIGRKGCERSIGAGGLRRAVLDRCNGVSADRQKFVSLAATWSHHATAVVFNMPAKLCEARAMRRADHPTLPPGRRVGFAIRDHSRSFQAPELKEGFKTIVRISSVEAALELVDMLSPPLPLLKFPRTAHLINLGAATDDDLVVSADCWSVPVDTQTNIVITEKMDGANMGISLSAKGALVVQNRSHVINSETHRQFRALDDFLAAHRAQLHALLSRDPLFPGRFTLYGEWVAATHSIAYSRLHSVFYAFDLFDRETNQFYDRSSLRELLEISSASHRDETPLQLVPQLWAGHTLPSRDELVELAQRHPSSFYPGPVEGIYIKFERGGRVKERSKIVRSDFLAGNAHWTHNAIRFNGLVEVGTGIAPVYN